MTPTVLDTLTAPWLPVPHRMDVLLCDAVPEGHTVTSAFALVLDSRDRLLLTHVDRPGRGWEVPGGHVDPGESPRTTAARELAEETGLLLDAARLTLLGGQKITLLDAPPPDYRYPSRGFMAFYGARLAGTGEPTRPHPDSECDQAEWTSPAELVSRCPNATWLPLHTALLRTFTP
ncbi:MAG TPA: NUDIX hydrolase [Thermomonospora sp.]|nr:NUDIX hydrolase [Thermomonospora sp.]